MGENVTNFQKNWH